jgi:hypothetical protein
MMDFYIYLAVGVCLIALLLAVFFKSAGKSRKQKLADRELIAYLGDEGMLRLYDQAETDNEREGIVEFVKEKLSSEESGGPASEPPIAAGPAVAGVVTPAAVITETENPLRAETLEPPQPIKEAPEQTMAQNKPDLLEQLPQQHASVTPVTNERRQISGMLTTEHEETVEYSLADTAPTHELPIDKLDWAAIEEALEKKREEYARIMAHNQLIQNVFAKIQSVESRVIGEKSENTD